MSQLKWGCISELKKNKIKIKALSNLHAILPLGTRDNVDQTPKPVKYSLASPVLFDPAKFSPVYFMPSKTMVPAQMREWPQGRN